MVDQVRARYGARSLLWGECGDSNGRTIAYQSFPDMERLRWLGIVGACAAHGVGAGGPTAL